MQNNNLSNSLKQRLTKHITQRLLESIEQKDDLKKYKGKWSILMFIDGYGSYYGAKTYSSEKDAITRIKNLRRAGYVTLIKDHRKVIPLSRIRAMIPIPTKED